MNNKGFTLAEIIVVIFIIGFLIGSVALVVGRTHERAGVITTLKEMNHIKKAIRESFYLDLGMIPEDAGNPEYATRYLCLKNDGAGNPEYQEMRNFLGSDNLMVWDRYVRKGWRHLYMEPDTRYHDLVDDEWYPVLTDAWKNYYHILMNPAQDKDSARIVSFGANGLDDGGTILPVPADIADDIVMFVFGGEETRSPVH